MAYGKSRRRARKGVQIQPSWPTPCASYRRISPASSKSLRPGSMQYRRGSVTSSEDPPAASPRHDVLSLAVAWLEPGLGRLERVGAWWRGEEVRGDGREGKH